jgi:hypothetical protein
MPRVYRKRRKEDRIEELKAKFQRLEIRKNRYLERTRKEATKVGLIADRQQKIVNRLDKLGVASVLA